MGMNSTYLKNIFKRRLDNRIQGIVVAVMFAMLLVACGSSDGVNVILDPELRMLRDDLPPPVGDKPASGLMMPSGARDVVDRFADIPPFLVADDKSLRDALPLPVVSGSLIELGLSPSQSAMSGHAEISLVAGPQEFTTVSFYLSAGEVSLVEAQNPAASFSYQDDILTVTPDSPVAAGENWDLVIEWHDNDIEVFVDYFPEGGGTVLANLVDEKSTFFSYGYYFWPRLVGESTYSALQFVVSYPDQMTLGMSGTKTQTADNGDGTKTEHWNIDFPIASSVGLALAEYSMVSGQCGRATLEIYAIPGVTTKDIPIVPATYVPIIEELCADLVERLGEPAFDVIRFVGVDERFKSGYSTATMILVPNFIWDDDGTGSFIERDFFLAHELSHQWWGNHIFIGVEQDLWLIEGMADYLACSALERTRGHAAGQWVWQWEVMELLDYYKQGNPDHPLVPDAGLSMESRIYYIKGAWVLRMLETVIGEAAVGQVLADLVENNAFGVITSQTFIDLAESVGATDLEWFFEQWLGGTGMVSLRENHSQNGSLVDITIAQDKPWSSAPERFFKMPLTVRVEGSQGFKDETVTIEGPETVLSIDAP
jgi:peptidase M1-like protein